TIEQTPSETQGDCQSALMSLSQKVTSTSTTFVLTVTAAAPLCDPIEATAAIYGMPGNGVAWPQQLLQSKKFTIAEAGVTVITFSKDCTPAQFDVINGVTPQTINTPLDHGPLLFPFDTGTAQQYWGCTTTTSTTTTSTTTTTTSTSTTVPAQVAGSTTIAPAIGATSTSTPPQAAAVAGQTVTRPAGAALALTGSRTTPTAIAGAALVLVGGALFLAARRRRIDEA
ncbi:MAG: LPXTG cell wall anchor domain-containing protein, partial [Microthrixaceae bacterium]